MNSSGKSTRSAPCAAASARAAATLRALPSRSPTSGLSWASAILMRAPARSSEGGGRRGRSRAALALDLHAFGDQECEFKRLVGVEARIAVRVVAVRQVHLGDGAGAAGALGDVLAGHLDVDPARVGALGAMDVEERLDLLEDALEGARLVPRRRAHRIAVHRIARPHD